MAPSEGDQTAQSTPSPWLVEPVRQVTLTSGQVVELRPLTAADAELMAVFFAGLTPREIYYFFPLDDAAARRLATDAAQDPAYRLIAIGLRDDQAAILGYMFLDWNWQPSGPPTYGACLRDSAQSSGLGRAMIEQLLRSAARSGVECAQLTVHADNWRALRLYQRAGFRMIGEQILESQGAKQYRMEVNLQAQAPLFAENLIIAARGGIGVGMAAALIQQAVERRTGRCPFILDRPMQPDDDVIIVTDLAARAERPFEMPMPPGLDSGGPAWITSLDTHHLLIGGIGAAAVERAARRYCALLDQADSGGSDHNIVAVPLAGWSMEC